MMQLDDSLNPVPGDPEDGLNPSSLTNQELLYRKALSMGFTGSADTDEATLLWWITTQGSLTAQGIGTNMYARVVKLEAYREYLEGLGKFVGAFQDAATLTLSVPTPNTGDYCIIGTSGSYYMLNYVDGAWIHPNMPMATVGQQLPTSLTASNRGTVHYDDATKTFYVWDGSAWLVEEKTTMVGNYKLSIEGV